MNEKKTYLKLMHEDIVISGISGRFPESDSIDEFAENLYKNVDMITDESRRWPKDLYGMCPRMGQLKQIDRFDSRFFGIMDKFGDNIDPQSRILLETSYEAIVDAGLNPQCLRGTKTGVYIGVSTFAMPEGIPEETHPDSENAISESVLWLHGHGLCLHSNRISFVFDFRGPSLVIDTACSSSLVALNVAINDMRLGKCEQAIVGGAHINLLPFTNHIFQATRLNAHDGIPKVWDEKADGYVRGEAVSCYLLQRKSTAKRIYATVLNAGINIDGNKRMGMFYPSAESQEQLMVNTYEEANVDPLKINYFEAHATGTKAGDPQEAKAIYNAYFKRTNRSGTLPIGLSKGIIGHTEGASGVSSMIKVLIAFENECIPANHNLNKIKSSIAEMCPPLMPVRDNYDYEPGIAGVTNFGIGGVNGHVLLEPNYKKFNEDSFKIADTIPRIINICCRTEQAFHHLCDWMEKNIDKVSRDFLALLTDTMKYSPVIKSAGFPIRGSLIIKHEAKLGSVNYRFRRQFSIFVEKTVRPLWFLFPGLGGQWIGMAKALMPIETFADKIDECDQILEPYDIDLKHLLLSDDKNVMSTMTNKFCSTTAIQIALFEVIKALNIVPDAIIGHSFGEIACAYADGCLNTREALMISLVRGRVTENNKSIPKGVMAVIGMSWNEAKQICPKGVSVVCNNAKNTVVVSGLFNETKAFLQSLSEKGVFVLELQSSDIPYHSEYLLCSSEEMKNEIRKHLSAPKKRSQKWISTAVIETDPDEELLYASAEYFVHNLISPVYFYNKLKTLPSDAIVVEIGPHKLFSKIVTETLDSSTYLSLIRKDSNDTNLDSFLSTIAKLYELGLNPSIENLYPKVEWPVARGTQSISSLIEWDHQKVYLVRKYPVFKFRATASDLNETIDIASAIKNFLPDHRIDGKILFPATGYLMLAWRRMASNFARAWNQIPVIFEDVQFRRPVFLSESEVTKLRVRYHENSGEFVILEHNNVMCTGKIWSAEENPLYVQDMLDEVVLDDGEEVTLNAGDFYKEMRVRGYDYGPCFRNVKQISTNDFKRFKGTVEWNGNWITFMDSLLQTMAVAVPFRKMMVPVMIKKLRCDPSLLYAGVALNKCPDEECKAFNEDKKVEEWDDNKIYDLEDEDDILQSDEVKTKYLDEIMYYQFHNYRSVLPFRVDTNSRLIVSHGVEIEDVIALPIPRLSNNADLKLESYKFVANEDMNAIEDNSKKIVDYIEICSTIAYKLLMCFRNDKYSEDLSEMVTKFGDSVDDNRVLMKILLELCASVVDENRNEKNGSVRERISCAMKEVMTRYNLDSDSINQVTKNEYLVRSLIDIVSENSVPKKEIKVAEINLTSALMATDLDNYLASAAIYPIDVNYSIVIKSKLNIPEDYRNKSFKISEWNPNESTFPSDVFVKDLIIIRDSPELWTLNLDSFVEETCDALVDRGFVLCLFRHIYTEPELALDFMNGKKLVKNPELEQRISDFTKTAGKNGLKLIGRKCDSVCHMAYLYRKIGEATKPSIDRQIYITNSFDDWFQTLKEKVHDSRERDDSDAIWVIANDSSINGITGLVNCLRLEPGGESIRCIFDCDNLSKMEIDFNEKPFSHILANDLAINVIKNKRLGTYRHVNLPKDYDKTESNRYFLSTGQQSDMSLVQWYDSRKIAKTTEMYDINNKKCSKIRVEIYSTGLNFKDVMFATGRIVSGPLSLFSDCIIGMEFAGRDHNGNRVMGMDLSRCFATSIDAMQNFTTTIPDHWSMNDAVSILVAYATVWYGLIERAHLQKNEKILIHSAAGGVGQAAINVCKFHDCDIFVTVGNEEKKKFLMDEYNIPENRIFSSRDIHFKYRIKALTEGKGVDIVLNSLAGDKLEASYECVADCGRFVEIGKYDLQMNKQLGMFSFLRDISFIGVAMDQKLFLSDLFIEKFFDWMHNNSKNGMIRPINRTIFRAEEAENAFRYMTTGKHIGKIVIKIRDEEKEEIFTEIQSTKTLTTISKTYFDGNKVYIISGGLGGFGLELLHWMLFLGARKFVLTSRHGVKTDYQRFLLKRLEYLSEKFRMFKTEIVVTTEVCSTMESTRSLVKRSQQLGTIGGVFHLALVLNDCLLENQTLDNFKETIDSKINAFKNLDQLSRDLRLDFDYFVVFSSVSCGKGNVGQTNYGFGNSVCERVCEDRQRDGLHGLAIQWGPIGDVGVAADTEIPSFVGISKQRINSCLDVLDKLLGVSDAIVSCIRRAERQIQSGTREARIVAQIWQALGIDPKTTPNHLTLGEIGMESMFAVELQQGLERDYDIKVTLNDVKNITIGMMKDFESGKVDEMRGYAEDAKRARAKLLKLKFVIPTEPYTRLNNIKTGKPLYFLPPLEGIFASMESLAERINRPVIGLNLTRDVQQLGSVKEINSYFTKLLHSLCPTGSYDLLATLDNGGVFAIKLLQKTSVNSALVFDTISDYISDDTLITEEYLLEASLNTFSKTLPKVAQEKMWREIRSKSDIDSKINKLSADIKEFVGKGFISKDFDEILRNSYQRLKMLTEYRLQKKKKYMKIIKNNDKKHFPTLNGRLLVVKSCESITSSVDDVQQLVNRIRELYFIGDNDDKFELEYSKESLNDLTSEGILQIVNDFFCRDDN